MNKPEITITVNDLPQPVIKAIEGGRKIEAIKLLREATRLGLANAKVLVDRASIRHAQSHASHTGMIEESNTRRSLGMILLPALAYAFYRFFIEA